MTGTDTPPNQQCSTMRRVSARRWLLRFFALLLLLILGWLGWQQYRVVQREAAAPVISIEEDGSVRVNGQLLVMGPDGMPPRVLEAAEGAPPVEETHASYFEGEGWVRADERPRHWRYPRSGVLLEIVRRVRAGTVYYAGMLYLVEEPACTLAVRGQRWWLGKPGPLDELQSVDFRRMNMVPEQSGSLSHGIGTIWTLKAGESRLEVYPGERLPPWDFGRDLFTRQFIWVAQLSLAESAAGGLVKDKVAAFEASGGKEISAGW